MLTKLGPFLLIPFLVSDWTDNQWVAFCVNDASPAVLSGNDQTYSLATAQWRQQLLGKIQPVAGPCCLVQIEATSSALLPSIQLGDAGGTTFFASVNPLYQVMSLQL
jgi:hypothetical protein